jgi:hypothetical protein
MESSTREPCGLLAVPWRYRVSEYLRRIRKNAENDGQRPDNTGRATQQHSDQQQIIAALQGVRENQRTYANERKTADKHKARRENRQFWVDLTGVLGLWAAAGVGVAAIFYATRDAHDQRDATREAFTAVQRAYIIVTELSRMVTNYPDGKTSIEYSPTVINVGTTQTRDLSAIELGPQSIQGIFYEGHPSLAQRRHFCVAEELGIPPDPDDIFIDNSLFTRLTGLQKFHAIVGPKQPLKLPQSSRPNFAVWAQNGKVAGDFIPPKGWGYFFGEIIYNDVFPKTKNHITKYCFKITGIGGKEGPLLIDPCVHWNCADDECQSDKERYEAEAAKVAATSKCP